jgi:hypothetical protein
MATTKKRGQSAPAIEPNPLHDMPARRKRTTKAEQEAVIAAILAEPTGLPGITIGDLGAMVERRWSPVYKAAGTVLADLADTVASLPLPITEQEQTRHLSLALLDLATAGACLAKLAACGGISPYLAGAIGHQWNAVDDAMRALIWDAGQAGTGDRPEVAA